MKKATRRTILLILILMTVLLSSAIACADTVPNVLSSGDYEACTIYVNGSALSQKASLMKGNIYIDIDTLSSIGDMSAVSFDTSTMVCKVDVSKLNAFFGDEETTHFIKSNAGVVELPLKRFSTNYDHTTRYYISLGSIAQICRLSWTYKSSKSVYIIPYSSYSGSIGVASGLEHVTASLSSGAAAEPFFENELLRIDASGSTESYYRVMNAAGDAFYVSKSELRVVSSPSEIYSYSRQYKKEDAFSGPINAAWAGIEYSYADSPAKIAGLDVIADHAIDQKDKDDGSCKLYCDYGTINTAKAAGYKWWLCAMDFNTPDYYLYHNQNIKSRASSNRTAAQYLFAACIYNADGINIDFEGLNHVRNYYIYFMQTLCKHADKLGLTTSICTYYDNGYYGNYEGMYPIDIFGQCCDFVCEMTYDDSTVGQSSGSVMPQWWWKNGTDFMADKMPKEKIMLGIAYYARCEFYFENGDYDRPYYIKNSDFCTPRFIQQSKEWKKEYGQYYLKVLDSTDNSIGYLYLNDTRSCALMAQYIKDNNMGGTIGWEYGYLNPFKYKEHEELYKMFEDVYAGRKKYADYVPVN